MRSAPLALVGRVAAPTDRMGDFLAFGGYSVTTAQTYAAQLDRMARWMGTDDPSAFEPIRVARYLDGLRAPASQRLALAAARAYLRYAKVVGEQVPDLASLRRRGGPARLARWLDEDSQRQLLVAARSEADPFLAARDEALVWLLLFGLRLAEVLDLAADDIRLQDGVPTLTVKRGKGGHERQVTIGESAYTAIQRYIRVARPTGRLLLSARGRPLSRRATQRVIVKLGERAGIDGLHPHTLRHSYGTRLARAGVPLPVISSLLGHASLSTTSVYLHADRRWIIDAVRADPLTTVDGEGA